MVFLLQKKMNSSCLVRKELKKIYGINSFLANQICDQLGFQTNLQVGNLSVEQIVEYAESVDKKYKVHENVISNKELLDLNYRLMQLKEVDINGNAKMLALNMVKGDINKMNTFEFKKMFMADKMYTVIKDLDSWLNNSFNSLNAYASL